MIELQTSRILPSNAPSLPENSIQDFDLQFSNRVLRERSGNGQHDLLDLQQPGSRRPRGSPPTENRFSKYIQRSLVNSYKAFGDPEDHRNPTQVDEEFCQLWAYIWKSDASEPFRQYRSRQPSSAAKDKDDRAKWPEHLECLFFKGSQA